MHVNLAYGQGWLPVEFPDTRTTVLAPRSEPGLPNERAALLQALQAPIGAPPLREWIGPRDRVCIAFTDITRATPNDRLIPWLLAHLDHVPRENITLLNQLGTHRPNTPAELARMLTPEVLNRYRVLNHEPQNPAALVRVGTTHDGTPALLNRHLVSADKRIITGFIEPHFFAGFSGGPKGIMPGCAGLRTVMSNHGAGPIAHPNATFGVTDGNPLWEELRDIALRAGPSFLVNVTLNEQRAITRVFAGDLVAAHREGCRHVKEAAMQPVASTFEVVVTTNSGYPLDLNLYQGVKGMSAGARILKPKGLLILACECHEGIPAGSPFEALLQSAASPAEILLRLASPGFQAPEQWQAQIQALLQQRADIRIFSSLSDDALRRVHLKPCRDISETVRERLHQAGPGARVAVLPQGPLTIPYISK
jgi:nickel-dependent lactate racemase